MNENNERLFQTSKEYPYCTVICNTLDNFEKILRCLQVDYISSIEMYCILYEVMDDNGKLCLVKYYIRRDNVIILQIIPDIAIS